MFLTPQLQTFAVQKCPASLACGLHLGHAGTEIYNFGPRRGLRPSLRWGQKWSSFRPEMLVLLRAFLFSGDFFALPGPGGSARRGPREFSLGGSL